MKRRNLIGTATLLVLAATWYLATGPLDLISTGRFPSPSDVWDLLRQVSTVGYANGLLYQHVLHSLRLVIVGFFVAIATGVPLGLLMGWSRRAEAFDQSGLSRSSARSRRWHGFRWRSCGSVSAMPQRSW